MPKQTGCALAAAWMVVAVLVAILVIFFLLSTLFDLHVWDEFWIWINQKMGWGAS